MKEPIAGLGEDEEDWKKERVAVAVDVDGGTLVINRSINSNP